MKKPVTLALSLLIAIASFAQALISGRVTDKETGDPLQGASVFAQNTTRGTVTDKDGNFQLHLEKGGYELIISFTGYASKTINLEVQAADRQFNLALDKADNSMSEVVIRSSNEVPDGWEKYGKFFTDHFIGATSVSDSCILLNPQVLKFLYFKKNDRLKVLASEPLQIENRKLGYTLRYSLDSFVHFYPIDQNFYRGQCLYTAMEGNDSLQQIWKANRREVYLGSRMQFLRSYYDSTLAEDGYDIEIPFRGSYIKVTNPYDTTYYGFNEATGNAEIWFPKKTRIIYLKNPPEKGFVQYYKLSESLKTQISLVDLKEGITVQPNGFFMDQKSWLNQGYWSWKKLADQLPYDYDPNQ